MINNIYILNLSIAKNNWDCEFLDAVVDNEIFYTLEEAIEYGKYSFLNMIYNEYEKEIISKEELDNYIKDNNIEYIFRVSIVSNNRKRFNTTKELMDYFNSNINFISNDNLFNFLLSLIQYYNISYDYNGNIISEEPIEQYPENLNMTSSIVDFTVESCKNGKYRFKYDILD